MKIHLLAQNGFFSTFHLSSTRTNPRICCINLDMSRLMQQVCNQVFDKKKSKACRIPARTCRQQVFNQEVCSWLE